MSNKGGWIKLYRELLEKPIWFESTPEQKTILITLLLMANHEGRQWEWQGQKYYAAPGQFVTSLPKIVEACGPGISIKNVRTALKRFEKYGFLADKSTNKNRLITINNWALYQDKPDYEGSQTGRQVAGNGQATGRQVASNKNVRNKECKNIDVVVDEKVATISKAIRTYEQVFGLASSINIQNIQYWCKDLSPELVIKALEITSNNNARSFKYTEAILRDWEKRGIQTVEDVEALEKQREVQQQEKPKPKLYGNRRIEEVPDHFKNPPQETPNPESVESARNALNQLLGGSSVGN
ncbi:DnaD domain protein [Enterococcus cecorum]|nr:DnaD domain protein [Enterococcus cecorum]CAI3404459.1 DnaD domain protein [Enterococcus cecorum]CAI3412599.1 DnaD domain protein [Enterococcus cecorum]CAI3473778.1 DnaD domain protein [Enterococcus cecorum]CAI3475709.1 DnaD domain protein [Enterococcus cecorum]